MASTITKRNSQIHVCKTPQVHRNDIELRKFKNGLGSIPSDLYILYRRHTLLSPPPPSSYPPLLGTHKPAVSNRINITQAQQANHSLCCVTIISDRSQQVRNIEALSLYCCSLLLALVHSPNATVAWTANYSIWHRYYIVCIVGFTEQGSWFHAICKRKWNFFPQICQKHYSFQAYSSFVLLLMHGYTNLSVKMCMYSNVCA